MQLSTFKINNESFAIPALIVEEFFRHMPVTRVYGADHRIAGMVNIRGRTAAVIDMRKCFSVPARSGDECGEMILLETASGLVAEARSMGLYAYEEPLVLSVDAITQIHPLDDDEIHPAPAHIDNPLWMG